MASVKAAGIDPATQKMWSDLLPASVVTDATLAAALAGFVPADVATQLAGKANVLAAEVSTFRLRAPVFADTIDESGYAAGDLIPRVKL